MTTILVPYHHDERLDDIPVRAGVTVDPGPFDGDMWQRIGRVCRATADAVASLSPAVVPVVFSGDCLVAGGTVTGVQRSGVDPSVVWFDAHGDVHTLETSGSGYLGGLSVRVLTGAHQDRYADVIGLTPVPPARALLVDARDLDPAEADYLAVSATRRIPVEEVTASSVPAGPLVIHVDLDVIDPDELPGLRFPAPGGPPASAVLDACARLFATGRVVALDVACPWWPTADEKQMEFRRELLAEFTALSSSVQWTHWRKVGRSGPSGSPAEQ
jgi:arginase